MGRWEVGIIRVRQREWGHGLCSLGEGERESSISLLLLAIAVYCWLSSVAALQILTSKRQVIDAEMERRRLLEESPIPSTNEEPVLFDTAEIPWWAWVRRFHLPEVRLQCLLRMKFGVQRHAEIRQLGAR